MHIFRPYTLSFIAALFLTPISSSGIVLPPGVTLHGNQAFIRFMEQHQVQQSGTFILKHGGPSNTFFNFGVLHSGKLLGGLAGFYAEKLARIPYTYDVIFGSAYKGIPFASATVLYLQNQYNINKSFAFNRKEAKDHGEGGIVSGADLNGKRVIILDDMLTTGGSIREGISIVKAHGGIPVGIIVAFDNRCPVVRNPTNHRPQPIDNLPVHALCYTVTKATS